MCGRVRVESVDVRVWVWVSGFTASAVGVRGLVRECVRECGRG